jgi:hypothetical protein
MGGGGRIYIVGRFLGFVPLLGPLPIPRSGLQDLAVWILNLGLLLFVILLLRSEWRMEERGTARSNKISHGRLPVEWRSRWAPSGQPWWRGEGAGHFNMLC